MAEHSQGLKTLGSHEDRWIQVQCEQALVFNGLNHVHVKATINSHHGFSVMEYSQNIHIS